MQRVFGTDVPGNFLVFDHARRDFADDVFPRLFRLVEIAEQRQVLRADVAELDEHLEIDELFPKFPPEKHDGNFFRRFPRLNQRQHLEQLVHRAVASREGDQRVRQIQKPIFSDEEVAKLEIQLGRDERVRMLLERQADAEPQRLPASLERAAVRRFHDAGTAAGANVVAVSRLAEVFLAPLRQVAREFPRLLVIMRVGDVAFGDGDAQLPLRLRERELGDFAPFPLKRLFRICFRQRARRSEKHDRLADGIRVKPVIRLEHFAVNANRARDRAVQKIQIFVGFDVSERRARIGAFLFLFRGIFFFHRA